MQREQGVQDEVERQSSGVQDQAAESSLPFGRDPCDIANIPEDDDSQDQERHAFHPETASEFSTLSECLSLQSTRTGCSIDVFAMRQRYRVFDVDRALVDDDYSDPDDIDTVPNRQRGLAWLRPSSWKSGAVGHHRARSRSLPADTARALAVGLSRATRSTETDYATVSAEPPPSMSSSLVAVVPTLPHEVW